MKKLILATLALIATPAAALATFDIGGGGSGPLGQITQFLQDVADWITGPFGLFCVGIALFGAVIAWNKAPQQSEWVGKTVRALLSALCVLGIGGFLTWMAGYVA